MTQPTSALQVETDDLRYLIGLIKKETKREMNCHAIGTIISFDATTATASVAFNYKKVLKQRNAINSKEYTDVVLDYPILTRCPVVIMGGGGAYTTYPIFAGDECLIMFMDRDMDLWLEFGSTQSAPNTQRMHDISDAIAIVGVRSLKNAIPAYSTTSVKTVFGRVIVELTNLVASIIDKHGQRLVPPGTGPVSTFAQTPPSGWLFMYGQTLGRAGSGAIESSDDYDDLFNILKFIAPNNGGSSFAGGDKIIIPDCRGRVPVYKNDMGGNNSSILTPTYTPNRSTLGAAVGEESHKLVIPEMPSHVHTKTISVGGLNGGGVPQGWFPNVGNGSGQGITDSTGNDVPHNNVQPGIVVNAMIKY